MRVLRPTAWKAPELVPLLQEWGLVDWTPERLTQLICEPWEADPYVDRAARYVMDKAHLWNVSDAEFIGAARQINPTCAPLLETPEGLDFLHTMSRKIMMRVPLLRLGWRGKA